MKDLKYEHQSTFPYGGHGKKVPVQHLNCRLRGVLGYRKSIEDLPEDDPLSTSDEEDMPEISDSELHLQE